MIFNKIMDIMKYRLAVLFGILSFVICQHQIPYSGKNLRITIYNQNKAFIHESRTTHFSNTGFQEFWFKNIPEEVMPSSIIIDCDDCEITGKQFIDNTINQNSLLDVFIGKQVELVRYEDSGNKTITKTATVISNDGVPVFEIDGKILVDPSFEIIFPHLPEEMQKQDMLLCSGKINNKKMKFDLDYLLNGMSWNVDYSLVLNSLESGIFSAWYTINNNLHQEFDNAEVVLVSGDVNFNRNTIPKSFQKRTAFADTESNPIVTSTQDYAVFHLLEEINLRRNSLTQQNFIDHKEIPLKRIYRIDHSINRYYGRSNNQNSFPVPVISAIEFNSEDIGAFNLPEGLLRVYETKKGNKIFVGENNIPLTQTGEKVEIELGRTADLTGTFTIKSTEIDRKSTKHYLTAIIKNVRNQSVTVIWEENITGDWKITSTSQDFEKIDSNTAQFTVEIPSMSEKEISFTIKIDKL